MIKKAFSRFLIFAGSDYYPRGGMEDFWDSEVTKYRAEKCAREAIESPDLDTPESNRWAHVYDCDKHEIVARFTRWNRDDPIVKVAME